MNGWERVEYIKPTKDFKTTLGFKFDEAFDLIAREVKNVQENVGLCEVNGFNRIEITGSDRHNFLDRIFCGNIKKQTGKVGLGYFLNHHGMLKGEATIANLPESDRGPARVWYGSAAASEYHDMDWLRQHLNPVEDVQLKSLTNDLTILVLAGPNARKVLSACSRGDWSKDAFPWLSLRECFIGIAPATVMGVSFSGELAYEIHIPNASLYAAYLAIQKAGIEFDIKLFGARAVDTMRLEKGFLHWKADILTEFDPFETGLNKFVNMNKNEFIGKEALKFRQSEKCLNKLVSLEIDTKHAQAHGGATVSIDNKVVGTITSGDWGHRINKNIAYAFIKSEYSSIGTETFVDILGEKISAEIIEPCPYDPNFDIIKS